VPNQQNVAEFRAALLCLIDQQRAPQEPGALDEDTQLLAAAQHHADEMLASDYFGHTSPSGETLLASGQPGATITVEFGVRR
jgi:uncharacterized protein YkwD